MATTSKAIEPSLATTEQRQEIMRLVDHPVITRKEKAAMLLAICYMKEDRAADAIANIKLAIDLRENFSLND